MTRELYRICRLTSLESNTILRVGVGRHHDAPADENIPLKDKRGALLVILPDGTELVYDTGDVGLSLALYGTIASAPRPGKIYHQVINRIRPIPDAKWYWHSDTATRDRLLKEFECSTAPSVS